MCTRGGATGEGTVGHNSSTATERLLPTEVSRTLRAPVDSRRNELEMGASSAGPAIANAIPRGLSSRTEIG